MVDVNRHLQSEISRFEQLLQQECESKRPGNLLKAYYRGALDGLRALEEDLRKEVMENG